MKIIALKSFDRGYSKLSQKDREKISKKIHHLEEGDINTNHNVRKMRNSSTTYRMRVGDIRIIFTYLSDQQIIMLTQIGHRGSIYKP